MELPKYMRKKIMRRAIAQKTANALQGEIEEWSKKRGIELEYSVSHVCLFTEPVMVAFVTIKTIEGA